MHANKPTTSDRITELLESITNLVLSNLAWVVMSIFIVSLPAATAGLFSMMCRWARGQQVEFFRDFFGGVRENWRKATIIGLLDAALVLLVVVNISIFRVMDTPPLITYLLQGATFFVALTMSIMNLYLWPLMVLFENLTVRGLIETSFKFAFAHLPWSLVMLVVGVAPLVVTLFFLPAVLLVLMSVSVSALLISWASWRIIRRYVAAEELTAEH